MTIYDKIREEKLKYDINREAAKISASSSRKIYSFWKTNKKDWRARKKQADALKYLTEEEELESIEALFPKNMRTDEIKKEINEIKKWADKAKRKDLKHKTAKYKNDFQKFETTSSFSESIYSDKISIHKADME